MCGIVGVARFGELGNENLRASALYLATSLLEYTETRGKDATGVSALFDDGNFFGQKMGVSATEFIARYGGKADDFDGLLTVLRKYEAPLRLFIGHCRKKSAGSLNNVDNHPIKVGNIIGIHNGTLKNHDLIFDNLKCGRDGEVDSEAIFRLMKYYTKDCKEPFTVDMIEEVCRRLEGSFSILAFNANNPNQLVSARDGRPAEYCLIKPLKLVLIASEKKFFESTIWDYNKLSWLHDFGTFTKLKESDVEFAVLPDDTLALFDLTKEITPDTKLSDLYETKAVPRALDRIWKVPVKTTTYNSANTGYGNTYTPATRNFNNRTAGNSTTKTGEADDKEDKKQSSQTKTTTETTVEAIKSGVSLGRVWNKNLGKYVKAFGKKDEVQSTSILKPEKKLKLGLEDAVAENELDGILPNNNESTTTEDKKTTVRALLTKNKTSTEDFHLGINAPVKVITPVETKKKDSKVAGPSESVNKKDLLEDMKAGVVKGLQVSRESNTATKAAVEAVKDFQKFENVYEVAEIMGIEVASLRKLPTPAFANRLISTMFASIFTAGWAAKCTDAQTPLKNPEERLSKAQRHIRVLKTVSRYMGCIIEDSVERADVKNWFKGWQETLVEDEVDAAALTEIFNAGDFRVNKTLKSMTEVLQKK